MIGKECGKSINVYKRSYWEAEGVDSGALVIYRRLLFHELLFFKKDI